ncbi:MAG TPA: glycosyltransferase [Roseomonas sp.]|nr:glycosyltransferase [Roseomonas sp.]
MSKLSLAAKSKWAGKSVLVVAPTPTYPIDFGNRRRIFQVCQRLKNLGAAITFLHYPGEADWRESVSLEAQRAMMAQWDNYYIAPVTQPLHMPPQQGDYHTIDEWWDPGVGDMLKWIFSTHSFDVVIVNYTWLSKALEFVPEGPVKILDTHDRFSGRREVLESNGIAPEFFYTTPEQEKIALDRADVVWAIKKEEEDFFKSITSRKVMTLLHAEPVVPRHTRKPGQVIAFGMVGARNNINVRNFTAFLEEAHKFLRKTLLPCEIVIAGTCCDLLQVDHLPFVRLLGRVETMDEFYDSVDVILGPMSFSTGLKIKIGEALSYGKGVIAHAHCFEGYVPTHPFQTLPSFWDMMRACAAVVRDPSLIQVLEEASRQSMHHAGQQVAETLEESLGQNVQVEPAMIVVLHAQDVNLRSPLLYHALEAAEYVAHQSKVGFYIDGQPDKMDAKAVRQLRKWGQIICSPATAQGLGGKLAATMGSQGVPVMSFRKLLDAGHHGLWFACIPEGMAGRRKRLPMQAVAPLGVLAQRASEAEVIQFAKRLTETFDKVVASDTENSLLLASAGKLPLGRYIIPFLWRGHTSEAMRIVTGQDRRMVTLLSPVLESEQLELLLEVCSLTTDRQVEVVYDQRANTPAQLLAVQEAHRSVTFTPLQDYVRTVEKRRSGAYLAAEIGESSAFTCLREMMHRGCIPLVQLFVSGHAAMSEEEDEVRWREAGTLASADLLADLLLDWQKVETLKQLRIDRYSYINDAGWAYIWDVVRRLMKERRAAAA